MQTFRSREEHDRWVLETPDQFTVKRLLGRGQAERTPFTSLKAAKAEVLRLRASGARVLLYAERDGEGAHVPC